MDAAGIVNEKFTQAKTYADSATSALTSFTNALNTSIGAPPTPFSPQWTPPAPPGAITPLAPPTPLPIVLGTPSAPAAFSEAAPVITVDEFTTVEPSLSLPTAPTVSYGPTPTVPEVSTVTLPNDPVLVDVALPTFLSLNTPAFGGVDLHYDYLDKLENIPTLELVQPTPYSYVAGPSYASALLDNLKAVLNERIKGGTGLNPAVEQAIWDRARSRETQTALANEAEVMRQSEALGFQLPSGVLAAQLREAQQAYYDKLSGFSRDVAIKQAELEQENLKQTIAQGMQMEGQLIDYSLKLEQMTFEAAKVAAENAIQIYNGQVEKFKALLAAYNTYAAAYKTIMDAELAKVEVYKAELQGEQTKAEINNSLVQRYKAQIEAGMSRVEVYKAQVGAANTRVQLEQTKLGAVSEQIKAYVAQVNAETAKIEAYKAGVQAETAKVDIYSAKAQAYGIKTNAQAEKARAEISRYSALAQVKEAEWRGFEAQVRAEATRLDALAAHSGALTANYKAHTEVLQASASLQERAWEASAKQYEAGQNYAMQVAKMNGDWQMQAAEARRDVAKAGTQVYAQLVASSYGMVNASAGITGTAGMTIGYSYGGDVSGTVSPKLGF
jgi:hypothetical protein